MKKQEEVLRRLVNRLAETKNHQVNMEDAVKSAEVLRLSFSDNPEAEAEAIKVKQNCESALESIQVQMELLTQMIEKMHEESGREES